MKDPYTSKTVRQAIHVMFRPSVWGFLNKPSPYRRRLDPMTCGMELMELRLLLKRLKGTGKI